MPETQVSTESDVRARMVNATIELLAAEGPQALQVRRVAAAVGVSSMVLYGRFGGMPQLVEAVVEEGFQRMARAFAAFELSADPVADMATHAIVYHRAGRENPHLFDLMFGLSTPGGYRPVERPRRTPGADGGSALDHPYQPVVANVRRAIDAKRFRQQDPEQVASEVWSLVHGFTALDLGGYFSHVTDPIADVFAPLMVHIAIGLGDTPRTAQRSVAGALSAAGDQAASPRAGS